MAERAVIEKQERARRPRRPRYYERKCEVGTGMAITTRSKTPLITVKMHSVFAPGDCMVFGGNGQQLYIPPRD